MLTSGGGMDLTDDQRREYVVIFVPRAAQATARAAGRELAAAVASLPSGGTFADARRALAAKQAKEGDH
eukprot:8063025-Lingulodinium_polyedra.AAC.1